MTRGIACSACGCADLRTTHTQKYPGRVKRRRQCRNCGKAFMTTEIVERKTTLAEAK